MLPWDMGMTMSSIYAQPQEQIRTAVVIKTTRDVTYFGLLQDAVAFALLLVDLSFQSVDDFLDGLQLFGHVSYVASGLEMTTSQLKSS